MPKLPESPEESPEESDEKSENARVAAKRDEFARMLDASFKTGKSARKLSVGDKVRGEILVIGKEEVYVSTGTMVDGVVPRRDLPDIQGDHGPVPHKRGDLIDLYVTQVRREEIRLSPNPTARNLADDLEDAFDMMLPVEGLVAEVCNGGFRVAIHGKFAFCPISQMDCKRIEQPDEYLGKRFEFKITQFEEGGGNIVVSRRRLLEERREAGVGHFASEHRAGDVVRGKVARLEKFGAFIELAPGIDGLAHVSELAWSRVNDPAEILQVGRELPVKILKIESTEGRLRVSLSVKQAGSDPWELVPQKFPVGAVVPGVVERREPYGLFIKLDDGVSALLPRSKAVERPDFPFDKLKAGDAVTVRIGELRVQERRISLDAPKDPGSEDWKGYMATKPQAAGSGFGTLADKLKAAMAKRK